MKISIIPLLVSFIVVSGYFLNCVSGRSAYSVAYFCGEDFSLREILLDLGQREFDCNNLDLDLADGYNVTSVDSRGVCVDIYSGPDCTGDVLRLHDGKGKLRLYNFTEDPRSFSACSSLPVQGKDSLPVQGKDSLPVQEEDSMPAQEDHFHQRLRRSVKEGNPEYQFWTQFIQSYHQSTKYLNDFNRRVRATKDTPEYGFIYWDFLPNVGRECDRFDPPKLCQAYQYRKALQNTINYIKNNDGTRLNYDQLAKLVNKAHAVVGVRGYQYDKNANANEDERKAHEEIKNLWNDLKLRIDKAARDQYDRETRGRRKG